MSEEYEQLRRLLEDEGVQHWGETQLGSMRTAQMFVSEREPLRAVLTVPVKSHQEEVWVKIPSYNIEEQRDFLHRYLRGTSESENLQPPATED